MSRTLTDRELDIITRAEGVVINAIAEVLGVPCDYLEDDMNEVVHTILDEMVSWGEEKKGIKEQDVYPYLTDDEC